MINSRVALEAVPRHIAEPGDDYSDIAPTVALLAASGDTTIVPGLHTALDRYLSQGNFYGRDLIAQILAGIEGAAALPTLLQAAARDLGDDQDILCAVITDLFYSEPVAARATVLALAGDTPSALRNVALWALGYLVKTDDLDLLSAAASDVDPEIRSCSLDALSQLSEDERAYALLAAALHDPDPGVRSTAIRALGYSHRRDAVVPITALADDLAPGVRASVAYALGVLGHDVAESTLAATAQRP